MGMFQGNAPMICIKWLPNKAYILQIAIVMVSLCIKSLRASTRSEHCGRIHVHIAGIF